MTAATIELLCSTTPGHGLAGAVTGVGVVLNTLDLTNIDDDGIDPNSVPVLLRPAQARELFNWLGVYLHTEAGE